MYIALYVVHTTPYLDSERERERERGRGRREKREERERERERGEERERERESGDGGRGCSVLIDGFAILLMKQLSTWPLAGPVEPRGDDNT